MDHRPSEIEEVRINVGGEAGPVDANARLQNDPATNYLDSLRRGLEYREKRRETSVQAAPSSYTIFKIPEDFRGINIPNAVEPELVSIGPYHRTENGLREFEEHKWSFLNSFLHRTDSNVESLGKSVEEKARSAWGCYSEPGMTSDDNFVKMMLLDGCFVVELLLQICEKKDDKSAKCHPVLEREGIIPILIRDLLKLENQLPYSLLQSFFEYSSSTRIEARTPYLSMLALRAFNLAYPGAMALPDNEKYSDLQYQRYDVIKKKQYKHSDGQYQHLLDLFYFALFLAKDCNEKDINEKEKDVRSFRPSDKAIPCVTQLRPSGIKFKSKKTERFLDISFRKRVLEIPSIAVNDFMVTVLINCIALEQCRESSDKHIKHITDYVSFMHCLINQPKDVSLLCSDGIISTLSHDDQYVVKLFNELGKRIVFNVNNCYLSKQFEELDSYYYSNLASMIRTYFSSPWAAISVFSAILIIVLTVAQTVYAVLGHYSR